MEPARGFTPPRSMLIALRQHSGIVGIVNSLLCEFAIERDVDALHWYMLQCQSLTLYNFCLRLGTESLEARGGSHMWGGVANAMEP